MFVLPIQIKKGTDKTQDIDNTMSVVNNFFAHWLKEVDIKRYPDDICILPTNNTVDTLFSKDAEKITYKSNGRDQRNIVI